MKDLRYVHIIIGTYTYNQNLKLSVYNCFYLTCSDELDLRRKTEIHEVEERKNVQIQSLIKQHEKAFSDIKNYYNDITLNNLALINTLKGDFSVLFFELILCRTLIVTLSESDL